MTDLELIPTADLVEEILRRNTFLGVIVHAEQEHRSPWMEGARNFSVRWSENLMRHQTALVLEHTAAHIRQAESPESP